MRSVIGYRPPMPADPNPDPTPPVPMSIEAFLVFCEERRDESWELWDGVPVLKHSPRMPETMERHAHLRAKARIDRSFAREIDRGGLPCESLPDGAALKTADGTILKPDALVRCGADDPGDDAVFTPDPVVAVEVLSPSNTDDEITEKTRAYFTLPTMAHVLVVDTTRRRVRHYARGRGDALSLRFLDEDDALALDPPGIRLTVAEVLPPRRDPASSAIG